ncbi:L-iditol 2-dehydrogenase [Cocleimonas sp. KMM 6892]|uniref:L-iditol 2-dehydrogenase n=1 Tax=unclassified Cocleimonas TaxID=2639732 RepID=UPI002DBF5CFD|nr:MULTISPECIES: L-iditol 2-dehydrogenase [unclassified Cocleimonas]MEB8432765.1 L-iditol 2-dehydrogenase [Cocleimonas sp. KMM 6892]MEC4715624.1 L-iditol 2-dehydrogenase [Cocleimonas sp. KMM 6895]MEC4744758.1 L-iditol 2-dehydrogenase [Cocleimonas sp. KMM 6896]
MSAKRLEGRVALITGSARGIGRSFAKHYIDEGAKVVIADINIEQAQATAKELGENSIAIGLDVTQQESIDTCVAETIQQLGKIDILINNAALFSAAPTIEIERKDYEKLYAVNVSGTLFMLQAVAKHMIERGEGGKIINMASQAGRRGEPLVAVYCSTKAAIISLTQSTGLDLIKHGINVNAISPGVVDGEHWDMVDSFFAKHENLKPGEKKQQVGKSVPYGRMGIAEDLTGMAVFLATSDADYIVAQTYNVDGGQWMS